VDASPLPTGTSIVRERQRHGAAPGAALYARVLRCCPAGGCHAPAAAARGDRVVAGVRERAAGRDDERPQFQELLTTRHVGMLVGEQFVHRASEDA